MTRPRPGRRGSSRVPASGRALLISGLLLASLLAAFARPTRGDALPMPEPAEGPVPDFAGPGRAPLLPAPEVTGIAADPLDLAGTQLALLDVAPALEPLSARLQPAPDTPLEAVSLSTPTVSGLAWRSGSTHGGVPCIAQMRGRPLDAITTFVDHGSFPAMVRQTDRMQSVARLAPLWVVSLPLLPSADKRDFAQCASGSFDGYFRQIGANLRSAGAGASSSGLDGRRTSAPTAILGASTARPRSRPTRPAFAAPPRPSRRVVVPASPSSGPTPRRRTTRRCASPTCTPAATRST